MSYLNELEEILGAHNRRREAVSAVSSAPACSLAFLRGLFVSQSRYLAWSAALMLTQLIEMLLLACVHYIYFPLAADQ
jgi:hypothetical protein